MSDELMFLAYFAPMAAVGGLFWKVSSKLGHLEAMIAQHDDEVRRLRSDILSLQTLMSVLVDARRITP